MENLKKYTDYSDGTESFSTTFGGIDYDDSSDDYDSDNEDYDD